MNLNHIVLAILDRKSPKSVVYELEIDDVDCRWVEGMNAKESRCHRAMLEFLLGYHSNNQVKAVCGKLKLSSSSRSADPVRTLLNQSHISKIQLVVAEM